MHPCSETLLSWSHACACPLPLLAPGYPHADCCLCLRFMAALPHGCQCCTAPFSGVSLSQHANWTRSWPCWVTYATHMHMQIKLQTSAECLPGKLIWVLQDWTPGTGYHRVYHRVLALHSQTRSETWSKTVCLFRNVTHQTICTGSATAHLGSKYTMICLHLACCASCKP